MKGSSAWLAGWRNRKPCRCAKAPQLQIHPLRKRKRFRAFLGVPIIQRRQLLGVWWYSNESCASMTKVKNPSWCACHPDGSDSFSVAVDCLVWEYRQTRIRALPAAPGVAIAEAGRMPRYL